MKVAKDFPGSRLKTFLNCYPTRSKVGAQHRHIERNTGQFVDLLFRTSGLDGAESEEWINQLSIFEKNLKTDNELLKMVGIQELNWCLGNNVGVLMFMFIRCGRFSLILLRLWQKA